MQVLNTWNFKNSRNWIKPSVSSRFNFCTWLSMEVRFYQRRFASVLAPSINRLWNQIMKFCWPHNFQSNDYHIVSIAGLVFNKQSLQFCNFRSCWLTCVFFFTFSLFLTRRRKSTNCDIILPAASSLTFQLPFCLMRYNI